jgi:hypothetical protein
LDGVLSFTLFQESYLSLKKVNLLEEILGYGLLAFCELIAETTKWPNYGQITPKPTTLFWQSLFS